MAGHDGLSLGYRISWNIRRLGLTLFGPAQQSADRDPLVRLHREREAKVAAARRRGDKTSP